MKLATIMAAIALACPTLALAGDTMPSPFFLETANVEKIECQGGVGSGARIDEYHIVTVAHVASIPGCTNDGAALEVVHSIPERDFAVMKSSNPSQTRFVISCDPIRPGAVYFAAGYAFGGDMVVERYVGTKDRLPSRAGTFAGMAAMKGRGHSGMSGGPVIDSDGNIVGVHAGTNRHVSIATVRLLSETYLCKDDA